MSPDHLRKIAELHTALGQAYREAAGDPPNLAMDTQWPLFDVLCCLADAADHLLGAHDCDMHGWEKVAAARDAARRILNTRPNK